LRGEPGQGGAANPRPGEAGRFVVRPGRTVKAMNGKKYALSALAAILLIALHAAHAGAQREPSACIACHAFLGGSLAGPVEKWRGSVHQQSGISCDFCHGGNPAVRLGDLSRLSPEQFADRRARAMSEDRGFAGIPSGKSLFDVCGQCHGASVDRYAKSIMGKAYLEGRGGPSCVLCHDAHRNAMPEVPKVCGMCHKDTTGFDRIDPMNVTEATVNELSGIRIRLAREKTAGGAPPLFPEFPEELESFQIGFVAFGAVAVLLVVGYLVYMALESRR